MKYLILLFLLVFSYTQAQTVKISSPRIKNIGGTKITVSIPEGQVFNLDVKTPKTKDMLTNNSTITTNSAIYKSMPYEVYATKTGKLFIIVPSKDGFSYTRKYIKTE